MKRLSSALLMKGLLRILQKKNRNEKREEKVIKTLTMIKTDY